MNDKLSSSLAGLNSISLLDLINSMIKIDQDHHIRNAADMVDTLKKHQTVIEQYFGLVQFETALTGKRGRSEKYALLTEDQCDNATIEISQRTVIPAMWST